MSEYKEKEIRKYPREYPAVPEKYTEEFVAIDHIELDGPDKPCKEHGAQTAGERFSDCHQYGQQETARERQAHDDFVRQDSDYHDGNKAAPDNNLFFEERSNPLSSKGN